MHQSGHEFKIDPRHTEVHRIDPESFVALMNEKSSTGVKMDVEMMFSKDFSAILKENAQKEYTKEKTINYLKDMI